MTLHVLIDGDNIQWETFATYVKDDIDRRFGVAYVPVIFCQTHVLIKFNSLREAHVIIKNARTTNKNATDARLLVEVGRLSSDPSNTIVVVSNDKIFDEIVDNEKIFAVGYKNYIKKSHLKKSIVLKAINDLYASRASEHEDVYLCDLHIHLGYKSVSLLRDYVNKFIPELYVAANDAIFYV